MRRLRRLASTLASLGCAAILLPASAGAQIVQIGSPLGQSASLNTAENLNYVGLFTAVPPNPEAPNGVFHTPHFGADTAIWSLSTAAGPASVPATGQVLKVELGGCAVPAVAATPLTQIHFQDLTPLPEGGAKVNSSSQAFEIPVCGQSGASPSTVTTYEPSDMCASAGDYIGFNDEGGYVQNVYRAGVPYEVLSSTPGAVTDSFIRNNGTGNGAVLSPSYASAGEGFATNDGEELMMRETVGTGADASHLCAGGLIGLPPVLPPVTVVHQTDGINARRVVGLAIYCRVQPECRGTVTLTLDGRRVNEGSGEFTLRPKHTGHVHVRVTPAVLRMIRREHGVSPTMTVVIEGKTFTQGISIKIL